LFKNKSPSNCVSYEKEYYYPIAHININQIYYRLHLSLPISIILVLYLRTPPLKLPEKYIYFFASPVQFFVGNTFQVWKIGFSG